MIDKNKIKHLYHVENMSTYQIAEVLGVSQSVVRYHLRHTKLRNHTEAQCTYLKNNKHQRKGKSNLKGKLDGKEENQATEEIQQEETSTGG